MVKQVIIRLSCEFEPNRHNSLRPVILFLKSKISVKQSFLTAEISICIDALLFRRTVVNAQSTLVDIATFFVKRSFEPLFTKRFTRIISRVVDAF